MPESVASAIRLPWAPARVSVCFLNNGVRSKISFRPHRRHSAVWRGVEYQHSVFDDDTRRASPAMIYIPSEIPGGHNPAPRSRNSTTDALKSEQRNSRATNPSNSNAWGDGRDWSDWQAGGWGHYPEEDWKVRHQQIEEKKEMAETADRNRKITDDALRERENSQKSFPPQDTAWN